MSEEYLDEDGHPSITIDRLKRERDLAEEERDAALMEVERLTEALEGWRDGE